MDCHAEVLAYVLYRNLGSYSWISDSTQNIQYWNTSLFLAWNQNLINWQHTIKLFSPLFLREEVAEMKHKGNLFLETC